MSKLESIRKGYSEKFKTLNNRRKNEYDLMSIEELECFSANGRYMPGPKLRDCYDMDVRIGEVGAIKDVVALNPLSVGKQRKRISELNTERTSIALRYAAIIEKQELFDEGAMKEATPTEFQNFLRRDEKAFLAAFREDLERTAQDFSTGKIDYNRTSMPDMGYRAAVQDVAHKIFPFLGV